MNNPDVKKPVLDLLTRLMEVSGALREAMLARDPGRIHHVVEQQEALRRALPSAAAEVAGDEEVQELARRLRRLQESNRLLASTFLRLYRDTFQQGAARNTGDSGAYGHAGRPACGGGTSFLVSQTG
jgi:hypothetical protein